MNNKPIAATSDKLNITLIGCGNMGGAMLRGWLKAGIINKAYIYTRSGIAEDLQHNAYIENFTDTATLQQNLGASDLLILAVKPQGMAALMDEIGTTIPKTLPVMSVAAGLSQNFFSKYIGAHHPFIHVMPNTPSAIGLGMSGAYASPSVHPTSKTAVNALLSAIGHYIWIEDEAQIDAVTAVSGSGPAYIFHFIEALTAAAQSLGFDETSATALARQTVVGAAALANAQPDIDAATLRQNVTSPGGTTEAGLKVLMKHDPVNLEELLTETVKAAEKRGKELGKA